MKLIDNASDWHKLWSIRFAILSALMGVLELVPPLWKDAVSPGTFATLSTVAALAGAAARVIKQSGLDAQAAEARDADGPH